MKFMKPLIVAPLFTIVAILFTNPTPVLGSEKIEAARAVPFSCLDMNSPDYAKVEQALITAAQQISVAHPDFTKNGYGYGDCLNLKKTSVLSLAVGQELAHLPDTCVGLSLLATSPQELSVLAQELTATQDVLIDGKSGSVVATIDGKPVRLPICLDEFSLGGPQ